MVSRSPQCRSVWRSCWALIAPVFPGSEALNADTISPDTFCLPPCWCITSRKSGKLNTPPTKILINVKRFYKDEWMCNIAPCNRATTNVIGPLHECKKVCPCTKTLLLSGIHAWIKQGWRKRKKRGRKTRKTEARRLMQRKAAQLNKNLSDELKKGLYAQLRLTMLGEECLTSPSHRMLLK